MSAELKSKVAAQTEIGRVMTVGSARVEIAINKSVIRNNQLNLIFSVKLQQMPQLVKQNFSEASELSLF